MHAGFGLRRGTANSELGFGEAVAPLKGASRERQGVFLLSGSALEGHHRDHRILRSLVVVGMGEGPLGDQAGGAETWLGRDGERHS
jgi:hypothetical protein